MRSVDGTVATRKLLAICPHNSRGPPRDTCQCNPCDVRHTLGNPNLKVTCSVTLMRNASNIMYHALIKTHHISSKKKIRSLRAASSENDVGVLIHVGVPGVMYVQGTKEDAVENWVDHVHGLRYKDYHLSVRVEQAEAAAGGTLERGQLEPVESMKAFGERMQAGGVWGWWRKGMGYE